LDLTKLLQFLSKYPRTESPTHLTKTNAQLSNRLKTNNHSVSLPGLNNKIR